MTVTKPAAKNVVAKKPVTAVETVLKIINRSRKGANSATLMKKTGFNQKKIRNVIYKLKKQGKVKSVGNGVYLKGRSLFIPKKKNWSNSTLFFFNLKNGVKMRKAVKIFTHQNPNLNLTFLRKMGWAIGIIQRNIKTEWIEAFVVFA